MENEDGSGANYNGDYFRDKKHGIGIYKWPSGNEYRGNYVNDKREGYGEMYWTDGSFYKGEWKEGIQHGKGKITFADGVVKEGQFVNNMYVDSKNYQYTIDQEDNNGLMEKSVYSHMPRTSFTAMQDRDKSYIDNHSTHKRRYSKNDQLLHHSHSFHKYHNAYHSPEQASTKFNIEKVNDMRQNQLSFTTPYKKRVRSKYHSFEQNRSFLPDINGRPNEMDEEYEYEEENQYANIRKPPYYQDEEYDSDYMGPRKPFMREDRSTSPPNNDPVFRRAHQRSVGIQESIPQEIIAKRPKKKDRSRSKGKKGSPQKIKISKNFLKKYPEVFKGIKMKGARKSKNGKVITVVYKPWVPASMKHQYFDEIAHKYKVY
jgi:hypothetical protein